MLLFRRYSVAGRTFPESRHHFIFEPSHDELSHKGMIALISYGRQVYSH